MAGWWLVAQPLAENQWVMSQQILDFTVGHPTSANTCFVGAVLLCYVG